MSSAAWCQQTLNYRIIRSSPCRCSKLLVSACCKLSGHEGGVDGF